MPAEFEDVVAAHRALARAHVLKQWAQHVRVSKCPVCCYYVFKFGGHDPDGIKAVGEAAK